MCMPKETNANEPLMTRRESYGGVETSAVREPWKELEGLPDKLP